MTWIEYLRAPIEAVGKVKRNPEAVQALLRLVMARTPEDRARSFGELANWVFQKQLTDSCGEALRSAKGFAADLLAIPEFRDHLAATPHLGTLASLTPIAATRLDYVALCMQAVLDIKRSCAGIGLGSKNQGVSHRGAELSAAEVAQTVLLVQNVGHLFGTFATERALLFHLDQMPSGIRSFVRLIDDGLRSWAESILASRSLYRFCYALAAYRVSRVKDKAVRQTLIDALKLLDVNADNSEDALGWAVRRARQIAYNRMHAYQRIGVTLGADEYRRLVRQLRRSPLLGFDSRDEGRNACTAMLRAIDDYHSLEFFCGAEAGVLVLDHLRRFKRWWNACELAKEPLGDRIDRLFRQPGDWPSGGQPGELELFLRLDMPTGGGNWISEVNQWMGDGGHWADSNFLLSPSHNGQRLVADVYRTGKGWRSCWLQVALQLAMRNEQTWAAPIDERARDIWRAVARFGLGLLQETVAEGIVATMDPVATTDEGVGYAFVCRGVEQGCAKIGEFIARAADETRRAELEALREIRRRSVVPDGGCWLAFLGRVWLRDAATARPVKELDGLWVDLSKASAKWSAIEHKGGKGSGAAQLGALRQYLTVEVVGPAEVALEGGGRAWQVEFEYR